MDLLFKDKYSDAGKSIGKRNPNQPRHQIYFDILPRNLWRLVKLSFLYIAFALPFFMVTRFVMSFLSSQIVATLSAGNVESITPEELEKYSSYITLILSLWFTAFLGQAPVTIGMTQIAYEYGNERPCWLTIDFWNSIKANFKHGILLWMLDLLVTYGVIYGLVFYISKNIYICVMILFFVMYTYILSHIYIYQIIITSDMRMKDILKCSILLAIARLPQNLLILLLLVVIYVILPGLAMICGNGRLVSLILVLEFGLFPALSSFTINFYIYPVIKKYLNDESNTN